MAAIKKNHADLAINGGKKCFGTIKTTMNLPAPKFEDFYDKILSYEDESKDPVSDLELVLSNFHKVKHVVCFSSCFTAMALTLKALGLPGKKEVIIPALTYRRMSDIVLWAGLIPCFCDNDRISLGVSSGAIEKQITEETAVILAPHPMVNLSDISDIEKLGEDRGIPVMFDSVEATAGTYRGVPVGSFGLAESFSLHPSKLINACEGGYITTNSENLYATLVAMRDGGGDMLNGAYRKGHYSRMNKYHSIMGLSSLDIVEDTISENYKHYGIYRDKLKGIDGVNLVEYDESEKRNYKSILIEVTEEFCMSRDELHDILNCENVYARKFYYPAQHQTQKCKSLNCLDKYEVAEYLQNRYLLLPFGHSTSAEDIRIICDLISDIRSISIGE